MAFPLVHPAAILPLRRFCPKRLDFSALVIGALAPDFAYVVDPFNKFSRTVSWLFGASAVHFTGVREAWDWDDFSHSIAGSIGFCLPVGLLILHFFLMLRSSLVEALPSPHRQQLLPLCTSARSPVPTQIVSILLGTWTHIAWDWLTNGDRWLAQHWAFIRFPVFTVFGRPVEVHHVVWVASTCAGLVYLIAADRAFVRRQLTAPRVPVGSDRSRYGLWAVVTATSIGAAIPVTFAALAHDRSIRGPAGFLHLYAGFYVAILCCGVALVGLDSALSHRWAK